MASSTNAVKEVTKARLLILTLAFLFRKERGDKLCDLLCDLLGEIGGEFFLGDVSTMPVPKSNEGSLLRGMVGDLVDAVLVEGGDCHL